MPLEFDLPDVLRKGSLRRGGAAVVKEKDRGGVTLLNSEVVWSHGGTGKWNLGIAKGVAKVFRLFR